MRKQILPIALVLLGLPAMVCVSSCDKNDPVESYYVSGEDVSISTALLANVIDAGLEIASLNGKLQLPSPTLIAANTKVIIEDSLLSDNDPISYVVDFGTFDSVANVGGGPCDDGRVRAGTIYITQSAPFNDVGCKIVMDLRDDAMAHYVGNTALFGKFTGTLEIIRTSPSGFEVTLKNGKQKFKTGTAFLNYKLNVSLTKEAGPGVINDEYSYSGTGEGFNRDKIAITWFIGQALDHTVIAGCSQLFKTGQMEVTTVDKGKCTIKYDIRSNRQCDNSYSISLSDGVTKDYKLN